jgi:hypothetical protein
LALAVQVSTEKEAIMEFSTAMVLIGAIVLAFCAVYFVARNERVRRRVFCPQRQKLADIEVVRRYETQKPVHVRACTLFDDPRAVDCAEDCLKSV